MLAGQYSFAQNYLEFIENKGQWDPSIRYRGEMNSGTFVLQKNGYRVLLHKHSDLQSVFDLFHPHASVTGGPGVIQRNTSLDDFPGSGESGGGTGVGSGGDRGVTLHSHVYEMRFLNANDNPVIIPDKPQANISNYILGNDSTKWASGCRTFQAVTYKNVYPNIDVRYYTASGVLKYDIIVNQGADVSQIAMYYEGVDNLKQQEGGLLIKTSVEEVKELPPYTYQIINNERTEIPCHFEVKGNIVRFKIDGAYARTSALVIDPALVFSTFTGSPANNWGYTATYDGRGNFYAGGIVFGQGQFPVSNGAFQTTYQGGNNVTGEGGGFDIGIMKFGPTGANRVYATYIGGTTGNEQPHSLVVDASGNLVISGRTTSSDYPTKGPLKQYGPLGGLWDIVLTKLNANGTALIASLKIGGSGNDGVNIKSKYADQLGAESINRNYGDDARSEVILDGAGNIYLASCTQSEDFPVTAGAFQTVSGGKNSVGRVQDAVVLKFSSDLSTPLFSTYLGGSEDDAAFVLAINPINNHLYAGGVTASANLPGNKTGVKFPAFQGGICDGFVAEFLPDGTFVRDGFFGTGGADLIYGIQFDKFGYPYIMGTTTGSWEVKQPAGTSSFFSQPGGKQFISKLKPDLSDYVYSTVFGTNSISPNISPIAFLVDRCENVYVSGWGGGEVSSRGYPNVGTAGLSVTPDAIQATTDGKDFYFFVLEKNGKSQLFGSFFGQVGGFGEHVDGGTSRFDRNGIIYQAICANCNGGAKFPVTPGVWSPVNGAAASGCNLAAVKIAFNLAGIGAGLQASINGVPRDTSGCVPLTADFQDTIALGKQYIWDFSDGSSTVTTTVPAVSHTFSTIGNYHVRLVSVDSTSCNISDTAYVTMRVRNDQAMLSFTATKLPPCTSLAYQFNNTSVAPPGKPFSNQSFNWDFGDGISQAAGTGIVNHTYASPGTYNVKLVLVDTNYCNQADSVVKQIRISPNVNAKFVTPPMGCVPYSAVFTNTSLGGQQFKWDFGDGTGSTETNPVHLYANTGTYTVKLVVVDNNTCNVTDSTSGTITVNPNPRSGFTYSPQPTLPNTAIVFLNTATGGNRYKWLFGDKDTLVTIQHDTTVQHLYNATGNFNACLVSYNNSGCSDTSCQVIPITIIPALDIPNAFSPNGDGRNDKIYVRGYGIAKMTWRIYNRWGTMVYIGTDLEEGWDGRYKGAVQPQDVYHYTLQLEFSTGEKVSKKGDITLLR
ncbi:MAG: hypothetical protein NVS3B15_05580 [Sediminibacterium sp.]